MKEDFIYYLWRNKLFDTSLLTTDNKPVKIIKQGTRNTDSGPDFTNARIKIGDTLWAGNVEIHVLASDWFRHGHHHDNAYDSIILHVVFEKDMPVRRNNGEKIPTLAIKGKFDMNLYGKYIDFITAQRWIPCEHLLKNTDRMIFECFMVRLIIERLEHKLTFINNKLNQNKNNWEQSFYEHLARSFGFNVNAEPFELLAKSLPVNYLAKHKNNLLQIEAMLFGQSGLLNTDKTDDYTTKLKKEYKHLREKFSLQAVDKHLWKFMRLRPYNFPTIRIAQLAALIHTSSNLFSQIIQISSYKELHKMFQVVASDYWNRHYLFGKSTGKRPKKLGTGSIDLIIINTIIPFVFAYGRYKDNAMLTDHALNLLNEVPPENNNIIKKWKNCGAEVKNALHSQSLLELKENYCDRKKCLDCNIGNFLIRM